MLTHIDHVQLTIPEGDQHLDAARAFYVGALGMTEVDKPAPLRDRGGIWFRVGHPGPDGAGFEVHLGIEDPRDTRRHPAFATRDLAVVLARCESAGAPIERDTPLGDRDRFHVWDPFGNRIEVIQYQP
jgi:catechol 2,3-dioxygenase-like lactoylglutathione lyase family enzyme